MLRYTRTLVAVLLLAPSALAVPAQEPIRLARTPDISPDGKQVAFSYFGDIYVVDAIGGTARAVTSHAAHDVYPCFSPCGKFIAFSSNRHGSYDVFVVSVRGGRPRRLTFDSANDLACGWSPDGKTILFASNRGTDYPSEFDLYTVPVTGGRARRLSPAGGKEGVFSPKGDLLAYVRGPGAWYRKGYRGSSSDDIWIARADGTGNRRLTAFNGQDISPMWSADAQKVFYVSERGGTANIYCRTTDGKGKPVAVTSHKESVRRARISKNGESIVYECGADLWVMSAKKDGKPRKLAIEIRADDKSNNSRVVTLSRGATEFAVSADEKFIVFAVHGKLFRMPVTSKPKVTQLTFGPANDHGAAWAPDGSKVIFISDRKGHNDLYLLESADKEKPKFTEARRFKVTQLTNTRDPEAGVTFSPDGKRVAFIRGGKLLTMAPDGKDQKVLIDQGQVFDYEWSPDSQWIVYARRDGSFASELYLVRATGATKADPIRNITRYATFNAGVTWSLDGKKLCFLSERRGAANLHIMKLEKPAVVSDTPKQPTRVLTWQWGSKPALRIDFDDLHRRVKPVVRGLVAEAAISPAGSKVAFRDALSGDLWVAGTSGTPVTRLTTGGQNPRQIRWTRRLNQLGQPVEVVYYLDGTGQIRLFYTGTVPAGVERSATLPYKVKLTVKQDELFREMFDQGWRYLSEHFYDEKFHGLDWDAVRKRYRPLVSSVRMKEDLYALMYLMLGELNASHLGVGGLTSAPEEETAELGLIWDDSYKGKGLKIKEILKGGPADRRGITLKVGDVVLSIDEKALDENANLSKLLNGKVDEKILLEVTDKPGDPKVKPRRVEVVGLHRAKKRGQKTASATELMYERWVARCAARVSALSNNKLGYIHIPSMDDEGLDRFVRSLYSDNFDKDAIVLDVRFNGGGFTHDRVLNYLGSREHTIFKSRHGGTGLVIRATDRKWHKPLVMLINNRSFSDAEILPSAFRTLKLGKLVGESTAGHVIGTSRVRLVDGSLFLVPSIGVFTTGGVNMEKEGVKPDVAVDNLPDLLLKGIDSQLDKAVEVLRASVVASAKKLSQKGSRPGTDKPKPQAKPLGRPR